MAVSIGEAPSRAQKIPEDYLKKVKEMHELGAIVSCLLFKSLVERWKKGPWLFRVYWDEILPSDVGIIISH